MNKNKNIKLIDKIYKDAYSIKHKHKINKIPNPKVKISQKDYAKLKAGLDDIDNYKYELENTINWFKLKNLVKVIEQGKQLEDNWLKPRCFKCIGFVEKGERVLMINGNGFWHRKCFDEKVSYEFNK